MRLSICGSQLLSLQKANFSPYNHRGYVQIKGIEERGGSPRKENRINSYSWTKVGWEWEDQMEMGREEENKGGNTGSGSLYEGSFEGCLET